jgi:bacterioferritin
MAVSVEMHHTGDAASHREVGDNGSGDLFQRMLKDEEGHADFLDAQLHSIKEMGIANYLSQLEGST